MFNKITYIINSKISKLFDYKRYYNIKFKDTPTFHSMTLSIDLNIK